MLKNIKILLKTDWQGWMNGLKHAGIERRKSGLKGIGYLALIAALSVFGSSLFTHLRLTEAKPTLILTVVNGFMIFGIIIVAKELMESSLKTLYESPEIVLLHAAPIQPVAIFGYKFIYLTLTRLFSILCFLGPPWVAFGVIFSLPWHFYIAFFPISLCLLIIIASYVTISVMVIARFFSSSSFLRILKVLGTAVGVTMGFLISLMLFIGTEAVSVKQFLINWLSTRTTDAAATWYPHEWMGHLLLSWTTGSTVGVQLRWVLGGCGISFASVGLAALTAQWIYQQGWENIRQLKAKRKLTRSGTNATVSRLKSYVLVSGRGKIRALMLKDFLVFIKHSGRLIAIIMLTLYLAVHIGVLFMRTDGAGTNAAEIFTMQIVLYSILISFGISCNGLREEARTWWMLKSAPVTPKLVFTSKFLTALCCTVVYAEFWSLTVIYLLRIPRENWIPMLLIPIITLPAVCAVNTMTGTLSWMAELTQQPKPFLRVLTFTVILIADIILLTPPIIAWYTQNLIVFIALIFFLAGVFMMSYRRGIHNTGKLLVAQQ